MKTCEESKLEIQEILTHLYDPDYHPSDTLFALTGCHPQDGVLAVQSAIIRTIESMKPTPDTPPGALTETIYNSLYNRYVLRLTQAETAKRLNVGVASAWRIQREAIHALARVILENSAKHVSQPFAAIAPNSQAPDWSTQVTRELASLHASATNAVSDVREAVDGMLELGPALVSRNNVRLEVGSVQPNLLAAVHPTALRQLLIAAVRQLAQHVMTGSITIYARLEDGNIKITATGPVTAKHNLSEDALVRDIVTPPNVAIQVCVENTRVFFWLEMPSAADRVTVLAVDDNPDIARFYRRCTEGTSYRIVHIEEGKLLFETIEAIAPDIIVLDVMLPDIDGWKLLMRLHEDPLTRSIPVVVCSVVRDERLATSLGAAFYLSKPVRRHEFVQALDLALSRSLAEAQTPPANSAAIC